MNATPLKDMIRQVNGRVNRKLQDTTDVDLYDRPDFWTAAIAQRDLADSTISKAIMLLDEGFPQEAMRLAMCIDQRGTYRAVLIATVEDGDWALDNQHFFITRPRDLGYLVQKIQQPGIDQWNWVVLGSHD